jgi:hypothetical protein
MQMNRREMIGGTVATALATAIAPAAVEKVAVRRREITVSRYEFFTKPYLENLDITFLSGGTQRLTYESTRMFCRAIFSDNTSQVIDWTHR